MPTSSCPWAVWVMTRTWDIAARGACCSRSWATATRCAPSWAIGPSLRRLIDADDPRNAAAALRGQEGTDDYLTARRLARALAWADLFVYSALEPQVVEDLAIVPLERPEQARRIVANSGS